MHPEHARLAHSNPNDTSMRGERYRPPPRLVPADGHTPRGVQSIDGAATT
jgi:hypothetical protein